MCRRGIICMMVIVAMFAQSIAHTASNQIDPDRPDSFEYLKLNLSRLYQENDQLFWKVYRSAEGRAANCAKAEDTAAFLELGPIVLGNSHLQEAFAKSIERLLVARPKCFLDGAVGLKGKSLQVLVKSYLKTPLFTGDVAIVEALTPYKNVVTYKQLMALYFE